MSTMPHHHCLLGPQMFEILSPDTSWSPRYSRLVASHTFEYSRGLAILSQIQAARRWVVNKEVGVHHNNHYSHQGQNNRLPPLTHLQVAHGLPLISQI